MSIRQLLFLFIGSIIFLSSCDLSVLIYKEKQTNYRLEYGSTYSPCCRCSERAVILDDLIGQQVKLTIICDITGNDGLCTYGGFGTQKQVDQYKGKFIIKRLIYKPVYDTNQLKKAYPFIKRSVFFYPELLSNQILPLGNLDSILIKTVFEHVPNTGSGCDKNYLKYIRGFVLVNTEEFKMRKENIK